MIIELTPCIGLSLNVRFKVFFWICFSEKPDEVIVIISSTVSKIPDEALKPCLDYANKIGHGGDLKKLDWFPAV